MLADTLGKSYPYFQEIKSFVKENYGNAIEEWKFYSPKYGWTMKLLLKKRNLFFFSARRGYFIIAFVFGDKAVAAVRQSSLPKTIIDELVNAKKYVEGRGWRLEVKSKKTTDVVKRLIEIKINN